MDEEFFAQRASTLYDLGRFEDGIVEMAKALASFPDSFVLHHYLSLFHLATENLDDADKANCRAIALAPDAPEGHYVRSLLAHGFFNFKLELEAAQEAVRLEPESVDFLARLCEAQLQSHLLKDARSTAAEILRLAPDSETSHSKLASIDLQLRDWKSAEKHYRAALSIAPMDIFHMHNLSIALQQQKKTVEAIDVLYRAMSTDAGNIDLQNRLITALESFLPSKLLPSKRTRAMETLPAAVQHFYQHHYRSRDLYGRYPTAFTILACGDTLAALTILFQYLIS